MRRKMQTVVLFLLIISTNVVFGKNGDKTKTFNAAHKKHNVIKGKPDNDRLKRSFNDVEVAPFWANRAKRQVELDNHPKYKYVLENNPKIFNDNGKFANEPPFWGNRGRRDSSSMENDLDPEYSEYYSKPCENCPDIADRFGDYGNIKDRREDFLNPFWGSRGRRNSDEEEDISGPFWGNRGKKQEDDPFWGNRGRRTEDSPFWGTRGRREEEPFWGNRGRRQEKEPFWGTRGRRDEEPFWGNRGRRQENEPFWGNRGRREEPFWGNRGRRKASINHAMRDDLKDSILSAIHKVENDIEHLSRLKKSNADPSPFWSRERDNKLNLFNTPARNRALLPRHDRYGKNEPGTVLDNRMYVDEPNYILVERSSRSSGEEDPYYISRGKKYYYSSKTGRGRRGAIEEIVKSVRNDPYYIARGKKNTIGKNANSTTRENELIKTKELICSAIDLLIMKNDDDFDKREINDNDRDRRTVLKKLAAQLQNDPYFVSRGKKNDVPDDYYLHEFINNIAEKCNTVV